MQPTTQNTKNVCFCLPTSKPHFSDLLLKANNDTVKKKVNSFPQPVSINYFQAIQKRLTTFAEELSYFNTRILLHDEDLVRFKNKSKAIFKSSST